MKIIITKTMIQVKKRVQQNSDIDKPKVRILYMKAKGSRGRGCLIKYLGLGQMSLKDK